MSLEPTDNFIVQRVSTNQIKNMDKIQDDDLMLVSRGGTNYKVSTSSSMGGSKVTISISLGTDDESFTTTITMLDQNSTKQLDY